MVKSCIALLLVMHGEVFWMTPNPILLLENRISEFV